MEHPCGLREKQQMELGTHGTHSGSYRAEVENQDGQKETHLGICLSKSDPVRVVPCFLPVGAVLTIMKGPLFVTKPWKEWEVHSRHLPLSASSPPLVPGCCSAEL